jgi:formate dehydrogenase subunit delta
MNAERLIHDANQIALYFAAYPHDEAVAGVADHIQKFWDPRMRASLRVILEAKQAGLHPLILDASAKLHA